MSWNKVFDYFIEIKRTIGDNFTTQEKIVGLIDQYCTQEQKERTKWLRFTQHGDLLLIKYAELKDLPYGQEESFWDMHNEFYRECRSLVVDMNKEEIVLSPYKKFLNMNELEADRYENIVKKIDKAKVFEVSEKLDGSMISARFYDGRIVMSTSGSLDRNKSFQLNGAYNMLGENDITLIANNSEYTFIFEYISQEDAKVVKYHKEQEGLYLIGVRSVESGNIVKYTDVEKIAEVYGIKSTITHKIDMNTILDDVRDVKSDKQEGYVLNIDGYMVKIKFDDYVKLHKIISKASSVNTLLKAIVNNTLDDVVAQVPDVHKDMIHKKLEVVSTFIEQKIALIQYYVKIINESMEYQGFNLTDNRKEYMIEVQRVTPLLLKGFVTNVLIGRELHLLTNRVGYAIKETQVLEELRLMEQLIVEIVEGIELEEK